MRFSMSFHGKLAAHIMAEADVHKVRPATLVRVAIDKMIADGLLDTMIADVDLREEDQRGGGHKGAYFSKGRRVSLSALARENGLAPSTVTRRVRDLHWPLQKALSEPVRGKEGAPC